jgi:hypothetical protein
VIRVEISKFTINLKFVKFIYSTWVKIFKSTHPSNLPRAHLNQPSGKTKQPIDKEDKKNT